MNPMRSWSRRMLPALGIAGLACATLRPETLPLADAHPERRNGPAAEILIDVRDPESGTMTIEMVIAGLEAERFHWRSSFREMQLTEPAFWGDDGAPIASVRTQRSFRLERPPGALVRLRYRVRPGGRGRHGHQGAVTPEFASFDGRVFLLPEDAAGLRDVRIRLRVPAGWTVASPFLAEADPLAWTVPGPDFVADTLAGSCLALGPFEGRVRTFGATEVRVFSHSYWSPAHRQRLTEKTFRLYEWFHRRLGFDLGMPYAVVWTPDLEGEPVFGGSNANGTCMEHPTEQLRRYELLAHRLAHAMNGYPPSGMQLRDRVDGWFREGWASYVELASTQESGVAPDGSGWDALYRRYLRTRSESPERDLPLAREADARGQTSEFLHYVKAPLVAAMLAEWIRSESEASLEAFMHAMWRRYGRYREPLALREELAAFTGLDPEPFWRRMVQSSAAVIPVWQAASPAVGSAAVATVAGQPVSAEYLWFLARSGDFDRYADLVAFLEEEERVRAWLGRSPNEWGYPVLPRNRSALPPALRYALALHGAEIASSRAARREPASHPRIRFDPRHPVARTFATLLAREHAYESSLGRGGVASLALRPFGRQRSLVLEPGEPAELEVSWLWMPVSARAEALQADDPIASRPIRGAAPKGRSRLLFEPAERDRGETMTFRIRAGPRTLIERTFWQQADPAR